MPKTVINLIKELGAKNTAEVLALLRQVGVDTEEEGFGVMSKVDDQTIARLRALVAGEERAPPPRPAGRLPQEHEPVSLDIDQKRVRRAGARDFFGEKKRPPAKPKAAGDSVLEPPKAEGAAKQKPQAKAQGSQTVKNRAAAKAAKAAKTDLSAGPRIISMPTAQQATADHPPPQQLPHTAPAPPKEGRKKPVVDERGQRDRTKSVGFSGRRRKIKEIGGDYDEERVRSRKRVFKIAGRKQESAATVVPHIKIAGEMSLREVAKATGVKVTDIVRFLMQELEIMSTINYVASVEEVQLVAEHFGIKYTVSLEQEPEGQLEQFEVVEQDKLKSRPPVITIMGHVDHGKTRLLDAIRQTNVIAGEAGGITQHIGAYQVVRKGKHITFLDTPGHEAFTAMRARGSQITDVVVLVVAADDGVMPQTLEALSHAKAAKVPVIVAVNKIDKPDSNPDRVKTQLSEHELVSEEWGGDTVFVNVSALTGDGVDELLEMILLTTELIDAKADPNAAPCGVVIESEVDTGIGVVATVLVTQGTMTNGQFVLSGTNVGRIKRMENDRGEEISEAGPSVPVRIIGFSDPPENGDKVYCFANKKQAQAIADQRLDEIRSKAAAGASGRMSLEAFFAKAESGEAKNLNLIIKADVAGSVEALIEGASKIGVEGAACNVIASGVGQINNTDVNLATAGDAVIIGFGVGTSSTARVLAEREHVDIRFYDIIYKFTEDIELAMKGLLDPVYEEQEMGRAEVREIFSSRKDGTVAGGYVLDGVAKRGAKYRLKRGAEVVFEDGTLNSLRRFKDDVKEVASGFECGFFLQTDGVEVQEGDILELFEIVEKPRV
ncbi:translation initiation factor IF-2 [bacterium]|nr:translation initiation factor IF-2 [bacterium]